MRLEKIRRECGGACGDVVKHAQRTARGRANRIEDVVRCGGMMPSPAALRPMAGAAHRPALRVRLVLGKGLIVSHITAAHGSNEVCYHDFGGYSRRPCGGGSSGRRHLRHSRLARWKLRRERSCSLAREDAAAPEGVSSRVGRLRRSRQLSSRWRCSRERRRKRDSRREGRADDRSRGRLSCTEGTPSEHPPSRRSVQRRRVPKR